MKGGKTLLFEFLAAVTHRENAAACSPRTETLPFEICGQGAET
jgi:hypothetical protein